MVHGKMARRTEGHFANGEDIVDDGVGGSVDILHFTVDKNKKLH
jgi:hypothetical protein